MKRVLVASSLSLFVLLSVPVFADAPIYRGFWWDSSPAAAYNAKDHDFLVVWNVFNPLYPSSDERFFGPVMGQLIKESGEPLLEPFQIFSAGVLPKVAYNVSQNQYLVVAEQWFNTVGQRVSTLGAKIGGAITLIANGRYPRVIYNSLSGDYLVTGAWLTETPSGSGFCNIDLYTVQVSAGGLPQGTPVKVVDNVPYVACADGAIYAIGYAPIVSSKAPQGRYLLAVKKPTDLKMLDSSGRLMDTLYNPQSDTWSPSIPFQQSKVGEPYNVDVAFGYLGGNPLFLLVWGDRNQHVMFNGEWTEWTGIWGGVVDAETEEYETTSPVSNEAFPISWQYNHLHASADAKQWKPVVDYNGTSNAFVVAWRETPENDPRDLTNVNHIRVNTVISTTIPPQSNLVASATGGTENPVLPCLATSTSSATTLIAWEDYRNILGDIYGTFLDSSTRTFANIKEKGTIQYWKSVAAGGGHSLAIRSDGSLWAWGRNDLGALGLGDSNDRHLPVRVGSATDWTMVSAGGAHSLGIRSDGSLWAWGYNTFGQVGVGWTTEYYWPTLRRVGSATDWTMVSAGGEHSLGMRSDGSLWAWGWGFWGQLGTGDQASLATPTPVGSATDWTMVSAGGEHSLGMRSDGMFRAGPLFAWGHNASGELGVGDDQNRYTPTPVGYSSDQALFSAGGNYSLIVFLDGSLWAWGSNECGQLGVGDDQNRYTPARVGSATDWIMVSAGCAHGLGIRSDGSLWAWGDNYSGQLGVGDTQNRLEPTLVRLPVTMPWISLLLLD